MESPPTPTQKEPLLVAAYKHSQQHLLQKSLSKCEVADDKEDMHQWVLIKRLINTLECEEKKKTDGTSPERLLPTPNQNAEEQTEMLNSHHKKEPSLKELQEDMGSNPATKKTCKSYVESGTFPGPQYDEDKIGEDDYYMFLISVPDAKCRKWYQTNFKISSQCLY